MNKEKMKKNNLIIVWKKYFTAWSKKAQKKLGLTDAEIKEQNKLHAQHQLEIIEKSRPYKDKTAREQANDLQLEYLDYLEYVLETGKLQYENDIQRY